MKKGDSAASVPRFRIARGTLKNPRSLIGMLMAGVVVWLGVYFGSLAAFGPAMKGFIGAGPIGLLALILSVIVYINLPGWLHLGTDGVLIDWRGTKQYVPFADIEDAAPYAEDTMGKRFIGVTISLRTGEPVKVAIGEDHFGADKKVAELCSSLRAALATYRRAVSEEDTASLERDGRSTEAWLARLRGFGEGANAGPRVAPIPVDRLWRVVEDPTAGPAARAGAAVALANGLDAGGKERLRIAAGSTAEPHLRIALEAAAAGDDEAVSAALEEVEGGSRTPPAA